MAIPRSEWQAKAEQSKDLMMQGVLAKYGHYNYIRIKHSGRIVPVSWGLLEAIGYNVDHLECVSDDIANEWFASMKQPVAKEVKPAPEAKKVEKVVKEAPVTTPEPRPVEVEEVPVEKMKRPQLMKYASENGIKISLKMKRDEMRNAILEAQKVAE